MENTKIGKKEVIKAYKLMMKALSHESRLDILYSLYEKPKTWTELLFELKINPKSLRDHLNYLKKSGLVRKGETVGFELTDAAKAFIDYSLRDVMRIAKQATQILRRERSEL